MGEGGGIAGKICLIRSWVNRGGEMPERRATATVLALFSRRSEEVSQSGLKLGNSSAEKVSGHIRIRMVIRVCDRYLSM